MKIQIKSIYGKLLFEGDFSTMAEAVASAIKGKADLSFADLSFADLRSAGTQPMEKLRPPGRSRAERLVSA